MSNNYLAAVDPELAPLIAALPAVPAPTGPVNPAVVRARMNAMFTNVAKKNLAPLLPAENTYVIQEYKVPNDAGEFAIRTYRPAADDGKTFPVLLVIHGGGFMNGDLEMEDYYLRILCVDMQIALVNVDYRLAPENPYPAGLNDVYEALKWTAKNAALIHVDLRKGFIVSGKSSGGNFSAVVAHRAKDDPFFADTPLTGHILQMATVCHPDAVPEEVKHKFQSMEQCKDAPLFTRDQVRGAYAILKADPKNPEVSPYLYPSVTGLSPAFIQVCGFDPCRDEGLAYAEKLQENGISTKVNIYPGAPHAFNAIFSQTNIAKKWNAEFKEGIRWLLTFAPHKSED
ncbi:Alpha/Beta hydrolase protein [Lenzites betulinus]|nr:Alpha/Beta hydrolase protein [Lenzites betulinus]